MLDDEAVRLVGSPQCIDPFTVGSADHQRIHVSIADGVDRVFGFLEAPAELIDSP
jgi:hypothetical protein